MTWHFVTAYKASDQGIPYTLDAVFYEDGTGEVAIVRQRSDDLPKRELSEVT